MKQPGHQSLPTVPQVLEEEEDSLVGAELPEAKEPQSATDRNGDPEFPGRL